MSERVFLNDKLVDADKACISASDSGFLYGAGLFETMRSRNGVVFRLQDHLDRLCLSSSSLSIAHAYEKEYLTEAIYEVLRANKLTDARLRLTLTGGPLTDSGERRKATLLITATTLRPYPREYYETGVLVVLCPFRQSNTDPTCGHKTTSYYSRLLALRMAQQKQATEALWFTTDHRLAEGCISNVFLIKDSVLYTPPIGTPVLAGIARKTLFDIATNESITLIEKDLLISDVLEADEIVLTNVIMEVLPVICVEKHTVGDGKIGPTTKKLRESFLQIVEDQCREQP